MPRPPNLIARDARIIAAYSAGATIPQIAAAEQLDPAIVRTTLRRHGISDPRGRHPLDDAAAARLADPAWLAAEYATRSAPQIAAELGCTPWMQLNWDMKDNFRRLASGGRRSPGTSLAHTWPARPR